MTEFYIASIGRQFIADRTGHAGMTFLTGAFNAEGSTVIVTTAAGFTLLHLCHGKAFISGTRRIQCRMAVVTAVGGNMNCMAKNGTAGAKIDLFDCMAFLAIR